MLPNLSLSNIPSISQLLKPAYQIHEDPDCRSTKEHRMELVRPRRTFHERFVDGPVWSPKPEFKEARMMKMGIPVAYKLELPGRPLTIIAHPEIAAKMRSLITEREPPTIFGSPLF